jgi:hypothetical protein
LLSQGDPVDEDEMDELSQSVAVVAGDTAIVGGGGIFCLVSSTSFSSTLVGFRVVGLLSSSETTEEALLVIFLLFPFGAGSRFGVVRL